MEWFEGLKKVKKWNGMEWNGQNGGGKHGVKLTTCNFDTV